MTVGLCEFPDCSRDVAAGFRLCAGCRRAVRTDVRVLPGLYRDCEARLTRGPQGTVERFRSSRTFGISLNESAVTVRSDIVEILSSWCVLVIQNRGVAGPGTRTPAALCAFLEAHLEWLAGHDAAADFGTEVRDLVKAARAVAEHDSWDSRSIGRCARAGCAQTVYVRTGPDGAGRQVRCAKGHVWLPHEWLLLSREGERAA
jgi:hypothetical protein